MSVTKIHKQIEECREELRYLETELIKPGKMVAGAVIQRYSVCGKSGCRCLEGQRHGPYPALSRPNGQVVYLNRKLHATISAYVDRYQAFQRHLSQWRKTIHKLDGLLSSFRRDQLLDLETVKNQASNVSSNNLPTD